MKTKNIIAKLKKLHPGKNIVINTPEFPLEIVCELDPIKQKRAVAIIDFTRPHYHKKNTEIYEVKKGELIVYLQGKTLILKKGERIKIKLYSIHSAVGKETWINVYSDPGWSLDDHMLVKNVSDIQNE